MDMAARTGAWVKSGSPTPVAYGGLRFTAESANSSVQLTAVGSAPAVTLIKSYDGVNWEDYTVGEVIELPNIGDSVYLAAGEGGNKKFGSSASDYHKFVMSGLIAAHGDITSIITFDLHHYALISYCYSGMFSGCTGLTSAPELPATTLETNCYRRMFSGCTGLTSAPELPATTIAKKSYCYREMFSGCTGLSLIKVHFTTPWATYTESWVDGVSANGTFYKPSALMESYGTGKIPTGWTVVNID